MRGMARTVTTLTLVALTLAISFPDLPIQPSSAQGGELDVIRWTRGDSPIVLNESFEVPADSVLEIEAGVEVRFGRDVGIEVRGELRALGTETDGIRFVPDSDNASVPRMWADVRLHTLPDDRRHLIRNATFEGADAGLLIGSANASVAGCVYQQCRYGIIARGDSFVEVDGSLFSNCSAVGMEWEMGAGGFASECVFQSCNVGVYCFEGSAPLITDSAFIDNYHHLSFAEGSNATVTRCTLENATAEHFECYWSSSPLFEDVVIEEPDGSRVFLREGSRPKFLGGTLVTSLQVDGTDVASYVVSMMRITVQVRDDEERRLAGANVTIVGASGDELFRGTTLGDGTIPDAVMANYTHSSSGGLDRENPQNVTVEWRGLVRSFHVDPRDLTADNVLVLELPASSPEGEDDLWVWLVLSMLLVAVLASLAAVAARRRE